MAPDELFNTDFLISLNLVLYTVALAGIVRARRAAFRPEDETKAFLLLERSLRRAFPDLPEGFTWREAMQKVEDLNLDVKWGEVEAALKQYEAWRYGESVKPEEINPEVVRLAKQLSGRNKKWLRV